MRKITFALVLLIGCTNNATTPGGGATVAPKVGTWSYSEVTLVHNTCNPNVNNGEAGNFAIDQSSLTSFHVLPNDGNMAFTCTLDSGSFDCPNRIAQVYDYRPSVDAVATIHVDANGTFSSATSATGSQDATVDCAGSACSAYGPFPCTFSQDFAIQAQ